MPAGYYQYRNLSDKTWQLYKDALDIAENGVPTVLDPVAAGVGPYRNELQMI